MIYQHDHIWEKELTSWGMGCTVCGKGGFILPTCDGDRVIPVDEGDEDA